MPEQAVIQVEELGKRFTLQKRGGRTLKGSALGLLRWGRGAHQDFWALREITFSVGRGEVLGIIGSNGAGKTTLLSLLAGTKEPTEGRVVTRGKISSLLELGAGFHPELTGRENIYLAGAIMGLSRALMRERFDAIVDFAELREFIDHPVKHYSSGMYVRLGFAVAVEVDPDVLLIDEVLAVGDADFQPKCLERMEEFRKRGKTMLIISHDMPTIRRISDRILHLEKGRIQGLGHPVQVLETYIAQARHEGVKVRPREWGTGEVRLTDIRLLDTAGNETDTFRWGEGLTARISYQAAQPVRDPVFGFGIADAEGRNIFGSNTQIEQQPVAVAEGEGVITLHIDRLTMASGTYLLSFSVHSPDHQRNYHRLDHQFPIVIEADKPFEGCYMPCRWEAGGGG